MSTTFFKSFPLRKKKEKQKQNTGRVCGGANGVPRGRPGLSRGRVSAQHSEYLQGPTLGLVAYAEQGVGGLRKGRGGSRWPRTPPDLGPFVAYGSVSAEPLGSQRLEGGQCQPLGYSQCLLVKRGCLGRVGGVGRRVGSPGGGGAIPHLHGDGASNVAAPSPCWRDGSPRSGWKSRSGQGLNRGEGGVWLGCSGPSLS